MASSVRDGWPSEDELGFKEELEASRVDREIEI